MSSAVLADVKPDGTISWFWVEITLATSLILKVKVRFGKFIEGSPVGATNVSVTVPFWNPLPALIILTPSYIVPRFYNHRCLGFVVERFDHEKLPLL